MKRSIITVAAIAGSLLIGYIAGKNNGSRLTKGFWVGIDPYAPRLIGVVNTTELSGTVFRASMAKFPLNNGWIIALNAYGGTSGKQFIETNVQVINYDPMPKARTE